MSYGYNVRDLLYRTAKAERTNAGGASTKTMTYADVLENVRNILTGKYAEEIRDAMEKADGEARMRELIGLQTQRLHVRVTEPELETLPEIVSALYDDMFGCGILTKYLADPRILEINANRWDDIEVCTQHGYWKIPERFASPMQAADTLRNAMLMCGVTVDASSPRGDGYLSNGTRIHLKIPPIIDEEDGVQFSIRKQRKEAFSANEFVENGTATQQELDFLTMCLANGVSIGICGNTGSGKTTDLIYLLRQMPNDLRIYTIEDTRELELRKAGAGDAWANRIMHTKTRYTEDKARNVDSALLVRDALRCDPDIIVPSEMRGAEAAYVLEAASTGHTTISTFHANSSAQAYTRIVNMALKAGEGMGADMLLQNAYEALPIIVTKRRFPDGSYRYMEITEAVLQKDGSYTIVPIFKYKPMLVHTQDADGKIREIVSGIHSFEHPISDALADKLLQNGAPVQMVRSMAAKEYHISMRAGGAPCSTV